MSIDECGVNFQDSSGELLSPDGDGQRRRSTRASALRAQERLRGEFKDLQQNEVAADVARQLDMNEEQVGARKVPLLFYRKSGRIFIGLWPEL